MALKKSYMYEVHALYNPTSGSRLGTLPNVLSDFGYNQLINTPGSTIEIEVGYDPAMDRHPPHNLIAEDTDFYLTTEDGRPIVTEQAIPIYDRFHNYTNNEDENTIPGLDGPNVNTNIPLIRNGNTIRVYEYSDDYPDGIKVFEGRIMRVKLSYKQKRIMLTVHSFGSDLSHHIIEGIGVPDQRQTDGESYAEVYHNSDSDSLYLAQSFKTSSDTTNIYSIILKVAATDDSPPLLAVNVYSADTFDINDFVGLFYGTPESTDPHELELLSVGSAAEVTGNTTYYFEVFPSSSYGSSPVRVYYDDGGNKYPDGTMYVSTVNDPTSYSPVPTGSFNAGSDLFFITTELRESAVIPFGALDQGDIFKAIVRGYEQKVDWLGVRDDVMHLGTVERTGTTYPYTYKMSTVLNGLVRQQELGPATWYWYGSVNDSLLHYREIQLTDPDHIFVKGKHLGDIDIDFSIEDIVNHVYFTGGTPEGETENLFKTKKNNLSYNNYQPGLASLVDNRVTLDDTADAIIKHQLDLNSDERSESEIELLDSNYDLNTIHVGHTVAFAGYGPALNGLVLLVSGYRRKKHSAILSLGILPFRQSEAVERTIRQLEDVYTLDNPDSPTT